MKFNEQFSSEQLETALTVFFRRPALDFSRNLRSSLDKDPEYLTDHASDIFPRVRQLLNEAGAPLNDSKYEDQMKYVVREIVIRLRTIEKGVG